MQKPKTSLLAALPSTHQRTLVLLLGILLALLAAPHLSIRKPVSPDNTPPPPFLTDTILDTASPPPTQPSEPIIDTTEITLKVKVGDTLSAIFKQANLGAALIDELKKSAGKREVLRDLHPGNEITFVIDKTQTLRTLQISKSPIESHQFSMTEAGNYVYTLVERIPDIKTTKKEAVITDSLFLAGQRSDIPAALILQLANLFGGVIDFILDTREGDKFQILYEEKYLDDELIGYGKILAAEFINQGKAFVAVSYTDKEGNTNFYNPEGESMRKAFLLNPVDFTRISDGFNLARLHPILNTIRAHKGTDYAAPRGTPVVSTADGRVTFADRNSSFGKLIVIQHNNRFTTKYAHLNDYAKGIKAGVRVRQGEVIGYVGATGAATGPHLHYEFLVDGTQQDSRKIYGQLPHSIAIPTEYKADFKKQTSPLLAMLKATKALPESNSTETK